MKLQKTCDSEQLLKYGFSKYSTYYLYKVPLYRYKKDTVIEMIITVEFDEKEKYITYDVLTNGEVYVSYYNNEYSKNDIVLRKVKRRINAEIKKLEDGGIIEPEQNRRKRKIKR